MCFIHDGAFSIPVFIDSFVLITHRAAATATPERDLQAHTDGGKAQNTQIYKHNVTIQPRGL